MKLPEIVPASPVQSAAGQIERAGAAAGEAGRTWGEYFLRERVSELKLEQERASIALKESASEAIDTIRRGRAATPEQVKALFDGAPPPGVELERNGEARPYIPVHEFAVPLFDKMAAAGVEKAANIISAEGWREKFKAVAANDVRRYKEEALDWARAQYIAQNHLAATAVYEKYIANREWDSAQRVLNDPNYQFDPIWREKEIQALPKHQRDAGILDALGSQDLNILEALQGQIAANKFNVPLTAEEQFKYATDARRTYHAVLTQREQEENIRYHKRAELNVFDALQRIEKLPPDARRKAAATFKIPTWLKDQEYRTAMSLRNSLMLEEAREDNIQAYSYLSELERTGRLVSEMPLEQFTNYVRGHFTIPTAERWLDRRAKLEADPAAKTFTDFETGLIDTAVSLVTGIKKPQPGDSAEKWDEWNRLTGMVEYNLLLPGNLKAGGRRLTRADYPDIRGAVAQTHNAIQQGLIRDTDNAGVFREVLGPAEPVLRRIWRANNPGRAETSADIVPLANRYKKLEPTIQQYWKDVNPSQRLTADETALIFGMIDNPVSAAELQQEVRKQGKDPEDTNALIYQAVLKHQKEISKPGYQKTVAEREQDVRIREENAAGAQIEARQNQILAEEKARWAELPEEERRARQEEWAAFESEVKKERFELQAEHRRMREKASPQSALVEQPIPLATLQQIQEERRLFEAAVLERTENFRKKLDSDLAGYTRYLESRKGSLTVLSFADWKRQREVQ